MKCMKIKKRKGFTLIEMVAVVAIIGILAAILVPKITGYMKEAKKTGVVDQARKIVQAYETAKMKDDAIKPSYKATEISGITHKTILSLLDETSMSTAVGDTGSLNKLPAKLNIQDCENIVAHKKEITVDEKGELLTVDGVDVTKTHTTTIPDDERK